MPESATPGDFFIADFSGRQRDDLAFAQQLDVAAPGVSVVGPYQLNHGPLAWFFLNGTSMASPHVAGIAALMAEKNPSLTQGQTESIPKGVATPMGDVNEAGAAMVNAAAAVAAVMATH